MFASTYWSVVLRAGTEESAEARDALGELCRTYWKPVYVFVRGRGYSPPDAEDLTQGFFEHLLERKVVGKADRERGRFRAFLLVCLKHYLASNQRREHAQRRCPGRDDFIGSAEMEPRLVRDPSFGVDPERTYERHWATTLLEKVLTGLEAEMREAGMGELFAQLRAHVCREEEAVPYRELAERTGVEEGTLRTRVSRLRGRYRERLREAIRQTVATEEEVDDEIRHLMDVLS